MEIISNHIFEYPSYVKKYLYLTLSALCFCGDSIYLTAMSLILQTAAVALSSLIQALVELDMVAITRRIYNKNSNPVMGVLFPEVTKKYEVSNIQVLLVSRLWSTFKISL